MHAVNVEAWQHRADKRPDVLGLHGHRREEQAACDAIMQGYELQDSAKAKRPEVSACEAHHILRFKASLLYKYPEVRQLVT